jgi:hypothetical protein
MIRSAVLCLNVVSAVALSGVAGAGLARASGGSPAHRSRQAAQAGPTLLPAGHSWTVTLITGDVVHVTTVRGRPPLVSISHALQGGRRCTLASGLPMSATNRAGSAPLKWCAARIRRMMLFVGGPAGDPLDGARLRLRPWIDADP